VHEALQGAALVIFQFRVGGLEARQKDEQFPLQYDICGDEGLGPGGLAAAWRTWPVMRAYLQWVMDTSPDACILLLTSPVGILCRCAYLSFPRSNLIGICELPWTTLNRLCEILGVGVHDIDFDYVGINHIGWFTRLQYGSRDLISEYSAQWSPRLGFPSEEVIAQCSAIPTKYLRLHYYQSDVLTEQRGEITRAVQLIDMRRRAFASYSMSDVRAVYAALASRPAPWYEHAVVPFVMARLDTKPCIPLFLSVKNGGSLPQLLDDDIIEYPHRVQGRDFVRTSPVPQMPEQVRNVLMPYVAYERVAASVVHAGASAGLPVALAAHPWIDQWTVGKRLAKEILLHN
jgi:6-phospho-beta-glucosidase